mmetsp:Transcript_6458/g.16457  ORF Transcript_6458/g.16457 Transcript_6458/m.16457 type:complete len:402 (-) Transcript_6458:99-1304(-)
MREYLRAGGEPRLWMYNVLITLWARRSKLDKALQASERVSKAGLEWDIYTYGALIDAYKKAQMPPYLLDRKHALSARAALDRMLAEGIAPNHVIYHSIMDCYAKAAMVDEAFQTLQEMERHGLKPTTASYNIIINACSKAGQPYRAQHIVERTMPACNIQADTVSWNGVLGAFAQAGLIDNAYHTWVEMNKKGLQPTRVTVFHLHQALSGSPGLLEELLREAHDKSRRPSLTSGGQVPGSNPLSELSRVYQPVDLLQLDLHRLSKPAAQSELLWHVNLLASALDSGSLGLSGDGKGCIEQELTIITGRGRHSQVRGHGVLQGAVSLILRKLGVEFWRDPSNSGRLKVPLTEIHKLKRRRRRDSERASMVQSLALRGMIMVCGTYGIISAISFLKEYAQYTR